MGDVVSVWVCLWFGCDVMGRRLEALLLKNFFKAAIFKDRNLFSLVTMVLS